MPTMLLTRKRSTSLILGCVLSVLLLFTACSGDGPAAELFQPAAPTPTAELIEVDPLATITFQVEIPANTPAGEPILLSLLDEVTGLGLNITRSEMQQIEEDQYSITLPFPLGANIKYRYARQADFIAEEHSTDQQPVRYRIYRVDGPGIVKDIVAAWSDMGYSGPTGRIMGKITSTEDGSPIPNLLVLAGGVHTITSSTGDYLLEGLPPGLHNLVVYAFDGSYHTYQQGAVVAASSSTPAQVQLSPAPLVKVIFSATVPEDTLPAVPVRLAGNLYQLGNTFADLSGGMNTIASRMPTLHALPDGRYALEMELPSGAYLEYKYTLGDGFWNSEYTPQGDFRLRTLMVPDQDTVIQDTIDSWGSEFNLGPILFDLTTPASTPDFDYVSIQFSPFGWMEPIPMWKLGENHWVYMLYSPITQQGQFSYRYCRNDQCGRADDQQTPGFSSQGRSISIPEDSQTLNTSDAVEAWLWNDPQAIPTQPFNPAGTPRQADFIQGIELQTYYHPSLTPRLPVSFKEIESARANWIFMSPTWTFTRQNPPVLESKSGQDQTWSDLTRASEVAGSYGLQVAYHPQANFPEEMEDWWLSAELDFAWWQVWFERYRNYILSFADKARLDDADGLVIGGSWVVPALPGGKLPDGSPSGVPLDAGQRWRTLISEVRDRFDGTLFWALPAPGGELAPPNFIEELDHVYLLWSLPLTSSLEYTQEQLLNTATRYLDEEVFLLDISLEMPITVAAAYPSADGSLQSCISNLDDNESTACLDPHLLEPPNPDPPGLGNDLSAQTDAYSALLQAMNEREWLDGFVSRGYYSPAQLQDKSASIHGKPGQFLLTEWFANLQPGSQTE